MKRSLLSLTIAIAAAVAVTVPAAGDGGPASQGVDVLAGGVLAPNGSTRYVALPDGDRTMLAQILIRSGTVLRTLTVPGHYGLPFVTNDGDVGGLSFDGRVLVMAAYGVTPQRPSTSRFALVDVKRWRFARTIRIHGNLSVDALSPKGRVLYLIEHLALGDGSHYRVRAYDLAYSRMLPGAIVDRRVADERMAGWPVTRAVSPGGTWVYTLYARSNGTGFVHALDTRRREAVCIDLPWREASTWIYDVRMWVSRDGTLLRLRQRGAGGRSGVIDTGSWKTTVSTPL